ncbi:MAG: rhomboid family intramembrane serine protease [Candidatus Hodarchaeales archaeon]|jgi:rhomboid protease GluP
MLMFPYQLLIQSQDVFDLIGQYNNRIISGEIYRLFTAIWIHGDVVHLISNLLFLLIFASRLEDLENGVIVVIVFICSGLSGNVATLIFAFVDLNINSIGASGAIFGLLGALLYLLRGKSRVERRRMYYLIGLFFVITISQDVNVIAHLFGLIGGYLTMSLLNQYNIG